MPSAAIRLFASAVRSARIAMPALSWTNAPWIESSSAVAYSGWEPTSR